MPGLEFSDNEEEDGVLRVNNKGKVKGRKASYLRFDENRPDDYEDEDDDDDEDHEIDLNEDEDDSGVGENGAYSDEDEENPLLTDLNNGEKESKSDLWFNKV